MNFGHIFDLPARIWPDKEALVYGENRITYAELEDRTNRVANGLKALGVGRGDHVAILVKNDHRFAETLLGALEQTAEAIQAGARGAVVGRNLWGHGDPTMSARAFRGVIHDGLGAEEALKRAKD